MAKRHNITFEQSATFQHTVNWRDPQGNPIDLTGFRARMQVRATPSATEILLDFDSENLGAGMTIEGLDETGTFTLTLSPAVTGALSFVGAVYDLTVTSPSGYVYRLHEGKATVSAGVTR